MTRNYLTYMANKETARSNLANEKETHRHNVVYEQETNRHNVAVERETNRHNVVTENQGWATIAENSRHNMANEHISAGNLNLGYAQLAESTRHNIANEAIGASQAQSARMSSVASQIQAMSSLLQADVAQDNAETNARNADTNYYDAQTRRLSQWTSAQSLDEQRRHNLETESQGRAKLELDTRRVNAEAFKDYTIGAKSIVDSVNTSLKVVQSLVK